MVRHRRRVEIGGVGVPDAAEILRSCSSLTTGMISGKPSMPLMKGYSTTSPNRLAKARNFAGGRSWSRKKTTPCSSQVWRMAAMTLWPGSAARSMPNISAPIEPDSGLTSNPLVAIARRSSPKIINSAFAGGKSSTAGRAMPTTAIEPSTACRGAKPQPGFTGWNTLADDGLGSVRRPCNDGPK